MSNIVIIYQSVHHNNTKKVIDEMSKERKIDIVDIKDVKNLDLSVYDKIGFASGVYYQDLSKLITKFANEYEFKIGQQFFIIYTCGTNMKNYAKNLEKTLTDKGCQHLGTFSCRGYDTFGLFKIVGGIAKKHPNQTDLENARTFIRTI